MPEETMSESDKIRVLIPELEQARKEEGVTLRTLYEELKTLGLECEYVTFQTVYWRALRNRAGHN